MNAGGKVQLPTTVEILRRKGQLIVALITHVGLIFDIDGVDVLLALRLRTLQGCSASILEIIDGHLLPEHLSNLVRRMRGRSGALAPAELLVHLDLLLEVRGPKLELRRSFIRILLLIRAWLKLLLLNLVILAEIVPGDVDVLIGRLVGTHLLLLVDAFDLQP